MFNNVRSTIGNGIGTYTDYATNAQSIQQYGRRSMIITPGVSEPADAVKERNKFLNENSWPSETAQGIATGGAPAYLEVHVAGYTHTLNNDYAPDAEIDEGDTIVDALDKLMTKSQFLTGRRLAANTTTLKNDIEMIRAGDFLRKMLDYTNSNEDLFHGWVDAYRNFYYDVLANDPIYHIRNLRIHTSAGASTEANARQLKPGIFRNYDWPVTGLSRNAFLAQRNDVFVEDIMVDERGNFGLRPRGGATDYLMFIKSNTSGSGGGGSDGGGGKKWKNMSDAEREAYIENHTDEFGNLEEGF